MKSDKEKNEEIDRTIFLQKLKASISEEPLSFKNNTIQYGDLLESILGFFEWSGFEIPKTGVSLYQCPCEKNTQCVMTDHCFECEIYGEWLTKENK